LYKSSLLLLKADGKMSYHYSLVIDNFLFKCNWISDNFNLLYKSRLQGQPISRISTHMHFVIASPVMSLDIVSYNCATKWLNWRLFLSIFSYLCSEDKKKCIEVPVACELLNLVLGLQFRPQVDKLNNYLMVMGTIFHSSFSSVGLIFA